MGRRRVLAHPTSRGVQQVVAQELFLRVLLAVVIYSRIRLLELLVAGYKSARMCLVLTRGR